MLLSIIIITYNTKINDFQRCLNSCLSKTKLEYEIIVVDDGSLNYEVKDYCNKYKNSNFNYYYKENGGAASARNFGLQLAKGKFIQFVDSDDYLDESYFENIGNILSDNCNEDIILCGNKIINNESSLQFYNSKNMADIIKNKKHYLYIDCLLGNYDIENYSLGAVWNKLYSLEFIKKNNVLFDINLRKCQDIMFNLECYVYKPKINISNYNIYNYCINSTSICQKVNDKLIDYYNAYIDKFKSLKNILINEIISENEFELLYQRCVYTSLFDCLNINVIKNKNSNISKKDIMKYYDNFENYLKIREINKNIFLSKKAKLKYALIKNKKIKTLKLIMNINNVISKK